MTDTYYALTVVLEKDAREDNCQRIIDAIKMIKGVLDVEGAVADMESYMAHSRARTDIAKKLWDVLYPKNRVCDE